MEKKAFTIKIDPELINEFKSFAADVGISPTAAIKMYMKTCVVEKKIPIRPVVKQKNF